MPDVKSPPERLEAKKKQMEAGIYLRPDVAPTEQTETRVLTLADMLSRGKSDVKVRAYVTSEYNVMDKRTIDSYMQAAYRVLLPKDWSEEKERLIAKNIRTLETIIQKTMDKENYKVAKEAIDSLNKMCGITGGNGIVVNRDNEGNEQIVISFD